MPKNRNPEIVATLKHGKIPTKRQLVFLWSCQIFIFVCAITLAIVMIIVNTSDSEEKMSASEIAILSVCITFFIAFVVCMIFLLTRHGKVKSEINQWLIDAVKLNAYCEEYGDTFVHPLYRVGGVGDVKVTFKYKGDHKALHSQLNNTGGKNTSQAFRKFVNKEIVILYSPKYKQVMILDEPREQTMEIL